MSQSEKAAYYNAVKAAGVPMQKPYRNYTTAELKQAYDRLVEGGVIVPPAPAPAQPAPAEQPVIPGFESHGAPASTPVAASAPTSNPTAGSVGSSGPVDPAAAGFFGFDVPDPEPESVPQLAAPVAHADPNEMAGARLNATDGLEPLRTDPETGRIWFQEEVRKPAYAKPRGRRVLTYTDPGTKQTTVKGNDGYTETFEVAGTGPGTTQQVKITLPSYQVGICKDPRLPFKIHTYNGTEGFDLFEVQNYYGGAELVPPVCKRIYVENVLCYDIRTVVRAINDEYRALQLAGKVQ